MNPSDAVPASEYDALIDLLHAVVAELTIGNPIEAVEAIEGEHDDVECEWLRRILIDGDRARELFA